MTKTKILIFLWVDHFGACAFNIGMGYTERTFDSSRFSAKVNLICQCALPYCGYTDSSLPLKKKYQKVTQNGWHNAEFTGASYIHKIPKSHLI